MNANTARMIAELEAAVKDCIVIAPGTRAAELLIECGGEDYIDNSQRRILKFDDGSVEHTHYTAQERSLAQIEAQLDKRHAVSDAARDKAIRLANAEKYRAQLETAGEFDYNVNEDRLYRAEMAFVSAMIEQDVIDADDLDD